MCGFKNSPVLDVMILLEPLPRRTESRIRSQVAGKQKSDSPGLCRLTQYIESLRRRKQQQDSKIGTKHFAKNSDDAPVSMAVRMREGNTSSCNKDILSITRVDTGARLATSLKIRIHLSGFICLQIHRHEVPLQATRIHARGNTVRGG